MWALEETQRGTDPAAPSVLLPLTFPILPLLLLLLLTTRPFRIAARKGSGGYSQPVKVSALFCQPSIFFSRSPVVDISLSAAGHPVNLESNRLCSNNADHSIRALIARDIFLSFFFQFYFYRENKERRRFGYNKRARRTKVTNWDEDVPLGCEKVLVFSRE